MTASPPSRRSIHLPDKPTEVIAVKLNDNLLGVTPLPPVHPVLQEVLVGEGMGIGRNRQNGVGFPGFHHLENLPHKLSNFVGPPPHPFSILGVIGRALAIMLLLVEVDGKGVIAERHGQPQVVIHLKSIHIVVRH